MAWQQVSARLVDQRLRNRIIEELLVLAEGDGGLVLGGATEWFENFFDYFPYEGSTPRDNTAIADAEWVALDPLVEAMQTAFGENTATSQIKVLAASGWPTRIAPLAKKALEVLNARGRFAEDVEQTEPGK